MLVRLLAFVVALQELSLLVCSDAVPEKSLVNIGDHRYYFSQNFVRLMDATKFCNDLDMTLVALETAQEFQAITNYITDVLKTEWAWYHTSGVRMYSTWVWSSSGQFFSADVSWEARYPSTNSSVDQQCVQLHGKHLSDWSCSDIQPFICEQTESSQSCSKAQNLTTSSLLLVFAFVIIMLQSQSRCILD